jgi:hypothetical protein
VATLVSFGSLALSACGGSGDESPPGAVEAGAQDTGAPVVTDAGPATHGDSGSADARADGPAHSDAGPPHDAGASDTAPPDDGAAPDAPYPAFAPLLGKLVNQGGAVMKHPVIVSITWNDDPSQASFDRFADDIGQTSYWKSTTSEYGIGAATSGTANHVHLSPTPAQMTDDDLQNMIKAHAGAAGGWPAPTTDTIYAYFLPPATSLQVMDPNGGADAGMVDGCTVFGGYHDQITVGAVTTSYAVVPSCTFGGIDAGVTTTPVQNTTISMSHELIEAATDPHPEEMPPGWVGVDSVALDWLQSLQDEAGDLCEFDPAATAEVRETSPVAFDYWVQRTWSNRTGVAGHDPCQPVLDSAPYFNVTPLHLDSIMVTIPNVNDPDGGLITVPTPGVHIAHGATATIPLGFYSDAPTGGPWTLSYSLGNGTENVTPTYLAVAIDKAVGQNGDTATATVTVTGTDTMLTDLELLVLGSTLNGVTHYMPVLVSSQ